MKNLTNFEDHLDEQYGVVGTETRNAYEKGYEKFKAEVLLELEQENQILENPFYLPNLFAPQ